MALPRAALVLAALLASVCLSASASGDEKRWARFNVERALQEGRYESAVGWFLDAVREVGKWAQADVVARRLAGLAAQGPAAGPTGHTVVPIEVVGNIILVHATVNGAVRAMLILDTSASTTLITPLLMTRLGQLIPLDARRREVSVMGGQKVDVPFVTIGVVQMGDARVHGLEVGVYDAFPEAPEIDGLLGADFLHRFRVTLDRDARRMTLAPLSR